MVKQNTGWWIKRNGEWQILCELHDETAAPRRGQGIGQRLRIQMHRKGRDPQMSDVTLTSRVFQNQKRAGASLQAFAELAEPNVAPETSRRSVVLHQPRTHQEARATLRGRKVLADMGGFDRTVRLPHATVHDFIEERNIFALIELPGGDLQLVTPEPHGRPKPYPEAGV